MVAEESEVVIERGPADEGPHDPLRELVRAQTERPATVEELAFQELSPYQRALLIMDGTVTRLIEAFMLEPVEVKQIRQRIHPLADDDPWLDAQSGEPIASRQVFLRGLKTGTVFAYASSQLVLSRLPDAVRQGLRIDGEGLGRLLLASRTEQYREILWWGRERMSDLPGAFDRRADGDFLSRTYRIFIGRKPAMLISEWFPLSARTAIEPLGARGLRERAGEEDVDEQPTIG